MTTLPMFPLGSVLLPGGVLPLHVFEPRYRALVRDCLTADVPEFGVVLIERGSEVGGGDVRRSIGTVARMVQVAEMDDGRYAVVAVGTRRIRVAGWLPDDPYPRADVDDWPDGDADPDEVRRVLGELTPRVRRATALAVELGDIARDTEPNLPDDPVLATYQLTAFAPLGDVDRDDLLAAPDPLARLASLAERLDDVETLLRFRLDSG